jgi:DNA-binding ferritin-like protein
MTIIAMGGVPVFNKELGKYVDKEEMNKIKEEAEQKRIQDELTEETRDYSEVANSNEIIVDASNTADDDSDEDLPF